MGLVVSLSSAELGQLAPQRFAERHPSEKKIASTRLNPAWPLAGWVQLAPAWPGGFWGELVLLVTSHQPPAEAAPKIKLGSVPLSRAVALMAKAKRHRGATCDWEPGSCRCFSECYDAAMMPPCHHCYGDDLIRNYQDIHSCFLKHTDVD